MAPSGVLRAVTGAIRKNGDNTRKANTVAITDYNYGKIFVKPPKVAHLTTVDISLRNLLLNQLHRIQAAGYNVTGVSAPGTVVSILKASGIPHLAVPITRNFTPFADLISLWRLYRMMRRERFVIVHTHTPKPGLLGQLAARWAGVPIVINTLHGFYFHDSMNPRARRFYITVEKLAARCSDVILSQNSEDIQTAINEGICPPEKIKLLGNGIDLTQFDPAQVSASQIERLRHELGIPAGAPVVGFVGRLAAKRKGVADLLAAAAIIVGQMPEVRFLIVGEADHGKPDAIEPESASDYGVAEQCLFVGQRPNSELPELYSLMDMLVLPSLFEGVPRAVMEAASMGKPCVVTDVKGNREAVESGQTGVLVPLHDPEALAAAILDLLSDSEKAQRMGKEGRRLALQRFDERLVFDKVLAEYERLLRAKGLPVPKPTQLAENIS